MIETRAGGALTVRGGDYPISSSKAMIAKYLSYAQIAVIGVLISGFDTFLPQAVRDNKLGAGVMVWFIGNALSSALTNTGAFEIYVGEKLIWSTLAEGGLPSYPQLMAAFEAVKIKLDRP